LAFYVSLPLGLRCAVVCQLELLLLLLLDTGQCSSQLSLQEFEALDVLGKAAVEVLDSLERSL